MTGVDVMPTSGRMKGHLDIACRNRPSSFRHSGEVDMPQRLGRRRRIERVDGVVLGRDVDDGVRAFRWNVHRREIEHLGIHVAVHGDDVDLAERHGVHGARGQLRFCGVRAGSRIIVLRGCDLTENRAGPWE